MALKQQASLKLAQRISPIQRFLHGSTRALPPPLSPNLCVGLLQATAMLNPIQTAKVMEREMEMEAWLSLA